jgi:hypothetical protein
MFDARSGATATPWVLNVGTGSNTYWYDGTSYTSTVPCVANAWNHVAVSRTSGVLKIFVNGAQGYSNAYTTNLDRTAGLRIGDVVQTGQNWTGYFGQLRIVKGTGVYPSAFTPPTTPLTAISGTSLLTNFANAGIYDAAWQNNALTVGEAQVSTTQYKWGTTSMKFDGTGDWLYFPSQSTNAFGNANFTLECWIYIASPNDSPIYESRTGNTTDGFTLTALNSTTIRIFTTSALITGTIANYSSTWTYVAVARSGSTTTLYVNGVSVGTTTSLGNLTNTDYVVGGGRYAGSSTITASFNGYIQDFRITKGIARTITTPTGAFPTYGTNILAVDYLVVAGGGGGAGDIGGGGGAGGYILSTTYSLSTATTYTVTVGGGGAGGSGAGYGTKGSNSVFSSITSIGGGGGSNLGGAPPASGKDGGSGSGARSTDTAGLGTSGQGNNGNNSPSQSLASGGGGGAVAAGSAGSTNASGAGGSGAWSSLSGTSTAYAGGGGGGGRNQSSVSGGAGGTGGGGAGSQSNSSTGTAGTTNTGGGGGGGSNEFGTSSGGGAGGAGIVILRIPSRYTATFSVGLTTTSSTSITGYTIYNITNGTGTVTFN